MASHTDEQSINDLEQAITQKEQEKQQAQQNKQDTTQLEADIAILRQRLFRKKNVFDEEEQEEIDSRLTEFPKPTLYNHHHTDVVSTQHGDKAIHNGEKRIYKTSEYEEVSDYKKGRHKTMRSHERKSYYVDYIAKFTKAKKIVDCKYVSGDIWKKHKSEGTYEKDTQVNKYIVKVTGEEANKTYDTKHTSKTYKGNFSSHYQGWYMKTSLSGSAKFYAGLSYKAYAAASLKTYASASAKVYLGASFKAYAGTSLTLKAGFDHKFILYKNDRIFSKNEQVATENKTVAVENEYSGIKKESKLKVSQLEAEFMKLVLKEDTTSMTARNHSLIHDTIGNIAKHHATISNNSYTINTNTCNVTTVNGNITVFN